MAVRDQHEPFANWDGMQDAVEQIFRLLLPRGSLVAGKNLGIATNIVTGPDGNVYVLL